MPKAPVCHYKDPTYHKRMPQFKNILHAKTTQGVTGQAGGPKGLAQLSGLVFPSRNLCAERAVETQGALVGAWSGGVVTWWGGHAGAGYGEGSRATSTGDGLCKQNTKSFWKWLNTEAGGGQETRGQLSPLALSSLAPSPRVQNTFGITHSMDVGSGTVEGRESGRSPAPPRPPGHTHCPRPLTLHSQSFHFLATETFYFSKLIRPRLLPFSS